MGNMKEKQEAIQKKLAEIVVEGSAGQVKVEVTANRQVKNIRIEDEFYGEAEKEEILDMVIIATNRALEKAAEKEAEVSQSMLKDLLPPGMDKLGGMFS